MKERFKSIRTAVSVLFIANVAAADSGMTPHHSDGRRTVGVYSGNGQGGSFAAATGALASAGYKIVPVSPDEATTPEALTADRFFLYVIPDARNYPADGFDLLETYLAGKGNLVTIGGPAFSNPSYKISAGAETVWYDKEKYEDTINRTKPDRILFDFESPLKWNFEAGDLKLTGGKIGAADGGVKGKCLAYKIDELFGWASYGTQVKPDAFPEGDNLLCLWAKGDEQTRAILLEIVENDGSRWLHVLPVTEEWKSYAVFFDDFSYWHNSITKENRGQPGDHLNPANAMQVKVGLAATHIAISGKNHHFWIDELGSAKSPLENLQQGKPQPSIETISPKYKVYPLTGITALKAAPAQTIVDSSASFKVGENLWSPVRRPQGLGYTGQNKWRWMPLVNAFAGDARRGSVASLVINSDGSQEGSICASFNVDSLDGAMAKALADTAKRMECGLFLTEAGSEYFSYYPGEAAKMGARVMNENNGEKSVTVRMQVTVAGKVLWQDEKSLTVKAHSTAVAEFAWTVGGEPFTVRTDLVYDGKPIDTIEQDAGILADKTKTPAPDEFVTVKGSDFYCQGKKWYPYGINYWPSYIAGLDEDSYWGHWLTPGYYSPDGIDDDLALMQTIGLNMASIQMHNERGGNHHMLDEAYIRNMLDFLRRCGEHGIKVNGFIPEASPINMAQSDSFNEKRIASYIRKANLANNPNLFAYDTIWEPGYRAFNDDGRKLFTPEWNRWIVERYGSAENAIADWAFTPEQSGGTVAPPEGKQMNTDGNWRIYVAAYRRFMDDFTSRSWNDAHRKIKRVDPNHLISYRQGNTSPVDFGLTGPIKHLDFISPEAYQFPRNDTGISQAGIATRYIYYTSGGKPVYWSEFGMSAWNRILMQPDPKLVVEQGEYIRKFYQMALESGACGIAPWWWPGGDRRDEESDFGVINTDGTLRPSAEVIKAYAPLLTADRTFPEADEWLTFDREAHAGGYAHFIMSPGCEAYQKARAAGKNLGIKTPGTGTDSANTPLLAVGNVPYKGTNPPKYLNAEFNRISIKTADGKWIEVFNNGQVVEVAAGKPVLIKTSIGNLGEAAWLAPKQHPGSGGVYLSSRAGDLTVREPILADTAYLKDAETAEFTLTEGITKKTDVVFEMTALDRMWFGEKFKLTLLPK